MVQNIHTGERLVRNGETGRIAE